MNRTLSFAMPKSTAAFTSDRLKAANKKDLACLGKGLADNTDRDRLPAGPENLQHRIPVLTAQRSLLERVNQSSRDSYSPLEGALNCQRDNSFACVFSRVKRAGDDEFQCRALRKLMD